MLLKELLFLIDMNYEFAFIGGIQNCYTFQTVNQVVYEIKFTPTPYLFGEDSFFAPYTYEFSILVADNPTENNPTFDDRTSYTVASIFTDFYERSNELITVYICDSSDGRQLIRQRKFNYWFYFFVNDDFVKYDDIIRDVDGQKYPVTIILKEQNPFKAKIIGDFIALIGGYNTGKQLRRIYTMYRHSHGYIISASSTTNSTPFSSSVSSRIAR